MITVKDLRYSYGSKRVPQPVLENINLKISKGESIALVGPSGCGKSTLLRLIAGLQQGYEGEILFNGEKINPKIHTIGFIQQDYGLLDWATVYENVVLGIRIKEGKVGEEQKKEAESILKSLGIDSLADKYPREISGGQRQRAAIAQTFLIKPDILLMDEPFSALDAITREKLQDIFLSLWRSQSPASISVTHSIEEAVILGEEIAIMSSLPGRIIKVFTNPLFSQENLRYAPDFYSFCLKIRQEVKELWK
ncbi:MAG: ABC transporter ATP-binding protein [Bacillota bacterium]|nr:ABC transporter ATP-binding protein [Bacillota bacterium]